ncbi:MAG TPA: hypothetical protein VHY83_04205 [Solirubrobacteraceae bacterium]|jgi:hypothetical protein|nr:hypothetical protein [Solirubrobacteraceae bacterium]
MSATDERPLGDVLLRAWGGFDPAHSERPPWHQPTIDLDRVEFAVTDNRRVVNLAVADRVHLRGLERPTYERDWLEYFDWTPPGWGVMR